MGDFDEAELAYQWAVEFGRKNPLSKERRLVPPQSGSLAQRRGDLDRAMSLLGEDVQTADAARKASPQPATEYN